ncbi:MAG: hypothetical protein ACLUTM_03380 [Streptococcus constellatus]
MIEIKFTGVDWHEIEYQMFEFQHRMNDTFSVEPDNFEKQKETSVKEEPVVEKSKTQEDVTALVKAKIQEGKSKGIKALLKKYGAAKVTALEKEHFNAFYAELEEL